MLEETKWGIGGLLNMMVLAAPVKTAVEFALELDNDKRWDPSFDMVLRKYIGPTLRVVFEAKQSSRISYGAMD